MPEREAGTAEFRALAGMPALAGMRIVVTGAAQGIGASTLRAYVAAGADVAALDVNAEAGASEAAAADAAGPGTAWFLRCDVGSRSSVAEAFGAVADKFGGRLDVLAHVAGIERSAAAEDLSDSEWDAVFDVNVKGTVYTNQSAFRLMRADGGTIINFTSGAALKPYPRGAHYSAAKAAVAAWTRTVAHEWGRYGIRVNSVAPAMRTPMYEAHLARLSAAELDALRARHRQRVALGGQLGDPDTDLAPVMVFLAGSGSRFITGQIIAVNGGLEEVR
jgi:NAD(P)-dependent dehydrogenase (short-subunit alcohol dehydrogenase family)